MGRPRRIWYGKESDSVTVNKPNIKSNEVTKKWEVYNPAIEEADCYIALTNHKEFIVVEMAAQAERGRRFYLRNQSS